MTDTEVIDFLTEFDKALLDVIRQLQFENMQLHAIVDGDKETEIDERES